MLRVLILTTIICVGCVMLPSVTAKTLSTSTPINNSVGSAFTNTEIEPSVATDSTDEEIVSNNQQQQRYYHPAEDRKPRVIEEFNNHFVDGSYEYKYVLSNGVARYEKSYWKPVGKGKKLLARKGFYSHPLTNHKYLTVFYTADEHGFQQNTAKYTDAMPTLPKHLETPQLEFPHETGTIITTTTTQQPKTTSKITTRKPKATTTQRPVVKPSKFNWIY